MNPVESVTITIVTGNDECKTRSDILLILRKTISRMEDHFDNVSKVIDYNGNTVGSVDITYKTAKKHTS